MTNRDAHGRKGALVAAIRGTKAETVIAVLEKIQLAKRKTVSEITLDLSSSMMLIARRSFPKVTVTNDRFHVQKLYYDAIDELRISLRWMVCDIENEEIARCRKYRVAYVTFRYSNGDTRKQLLARAKYILTRHASKWTRSQQRRADIIFEFYPELKKAYDLAMELTDIFNKKLIRTWPDSIWPGGMIRSTAWTAVSSEQLPIPSEIITIQSLTTSSTEPLTPEPSPSMPK